MTAIDHFLLPTKHFIQRYCLNFLSVNLVTLLITRFTFNIQTVLDPKLYMTSFGLKYLVLAIGVSLALSIIKGKSGNQQCD